MEMPIFDRILSTPASTAAWNRPWASGLVRSPSSWRSASAGHGRERQAGADGVGAVAEQGGEAVDVAHVVGHHHERGPRPQAALAEALVDGTGRQQRRDRRPVGPGVVGSRTSDARAALDGGHRLVAPGGRRRPAGPPGPSATGKVASSGMTGHGALSVSSRSSTPDGYRKNDGSVSSSAASAASVRSGGPGAEQRAQAHDQPLAQGVDGRVGDLGEALAQVVVPAAGGGRPGWAAASRRPWRRWAPWRRRPWA